MALVGDYRRGKASEFWVDSVASMRGRRVAAKCADACSPHLHNTQREKRGEEISRSHIRIFYHRRTTALTLTRITTCVALEFTYLHF